MTKKELKEYCRLKKEQADVKKRIEKLKKEMDSLKSGAVEADVVSKGKRGKKPLGKTKIEGFPDRRWSKLKSQKMGALLANETLAEQINNQVSEVDEYICSIKDSEMRQILRTLCLSDKYLTWQQLADRLNKRGGMFYTDESVRKKVERFLAK